MILASLLVAFAPQIVSAEEPADPVRAFLDRYCASCHDAVARKGGLDLLDAVDRGLDGIRDDARLWRDVSDVVRGRRMPPRRTRRQPDDAERDAFELALRGLVRAAAEAVAPDPGAPTLRRLNRTEYRNTLRDLLGVDVDVASALPEDPRGHGFDTVGDVLFVSPMLIEKYWEATRRTLDALFADRAALDRILFVRPEDGGDPSLAAARVLRPLLRRAFRRPVGDAELARRVAAVDATIAAGGTYDRGMRRAFASVLLSPDFLFRVEAEPQAAAAGTAWPLSDHELATRLSYFLWATMPDAELASLADAGRLTDPVELHGQVKRMLDDPRARSLADGFGAQWLGYAGIRELARDVRRFGGFAKIRDSMYAEASATVDALFREDRSVLELLDADTTWLDARLARHYGIDGVVGPELRRVHLPDRTRGGVLGWAAVLTATSTPLRTSPVVRGRFVLEELLGDPPPPPPPNAGQLPEDDQLDDGLSLRERLERHRRDPTCAGCHARIDPYGLALEGFDGIGRQRSEAYGRPIDATATLPDGRTIDGVIDLKDHLLTRRDRFVRTMSEKLMIYALGRPLDGSDERTLDSVVDGVARDGYRARTMVWRIVRSLPFRYRSRG